MSHARDEAIREGEHPEPDALAARPPDAAAPGATEGSAPAADASADDVAEDSGFEAAPAAEAGEGEDLAEDMPEEPEAEPEPEPVDFGRTFESLQRHHVAPAMIALDRIDEDPLFRVSPEGDVSALATDIARLGQLFPVDLRLKPPDRFQIICGFRRVAALRFLQRDRVLARLHTDLTDEDALVMALASAIHARQVTPDELRALRSRLEGDGKLTPATRSMIDQALSPGDELAPETVGEEEVDADEFAQQVTMRLGELNQDLSMLADVFDSLDESRQAQLLEQLRYSADLVEFLEGRR